MVSLQSVSEHMIKAWCSLKLFGVITEAELSKAAAPPPPPKPFQEFRAVSQNRMVSGSKATLSHTYWTA